MLTLMRILIITYILAINVYGFILLAFQKKQSADDETSKIKDGKILISGLLGGAIGIYVAMFVTKHKLHSLLFMIIIPLLIVINVYVIVVGFTWDFGVVEVFNSLLI
jgi:uncharacterized membrane protein YsdA (DUF1294 family)